MDRPRTFIMVVAVVLAVAIYAGLQAHRKMAVNDSLKQVFSSGINQGTVLRDLQKMGASAVPTEVRALSQTGELGDAAELALLNNPSAPAVLPKIVQLLQDTNSRVRQRAASVVEQHIQSQDTFALPALTKALNDTNEYVREGMALALSKFGPAAVTAVPSLTKALDDGSARVRIMAATALLKIDASQEAAVIPVLEDVVANGNVRDRYWAAVCLHGIQPKNTEIIPVFILSLTNQDNDIRSSAAYSLLQYGSDAKAAIPALRKALDDPDTEVQKAARETLGRIDPEALNKANVQN